MVMNVVSLLKQASLQHASDVHFATGQPPWLRVDGQLRALEPAACSDEDMKILLQTVMSTEQQQKFTQRRELDFAFTIEDGMRLRVTAFQRQSGSAVVFRLLPRQIPSLVKLHLSPVFTTVCQYTQGLVLVTGATGSGKSTTLAAMLDYINQTQAKHIITIEDPIELVHTVKRSLINQREVHTHTYNFSHALRSALRADPDVILIGELRDLETIRLALTAAETGHLVFATLHTQSAAKSIHRIVDVFPGGEKEWVRSMLAESLRAIMAQTLLPKMGGGRVAAQEILLCNSAVRNLIRENKSAQIYSQMQTGARDGMRTLEMHIKELRTKQLISAATAQQYITDVAGY